MARVRPLVLPQGALHEGRLTLPDDAARHVRDVLRLQPGAPVWATDGAGVVADGRVAEVERRRTVVELEAPRACAPPPPPAVTLFQSVGKGDKLETVVRQAVELGVRVVQPLLTDRTVARRAGAAGRLAGIAEDAMRVSRRAWRPEIRPPATLPQVLATPRVGPAFVLALGGGTSLVAALQTLSRPDAVELLVGPEGGFTGDEVEAAEAAGFRRAHMGPHTLRTETAGAAVVALAVALGGAWESATDATTRD